MAAKLEVKLNKILVIAVIARPINMNILPGILSPMYPFISWPIPYIQKKKLPMSPKPALLQPNAC